MNLLVELIVAAIREMSKGKPAKRITAPGWNEIEQQRLATEQRIREMQAAIAEQKARARPKKKRGPGRGAAVAQEVKAVPTLSQTPDAYTTPMPAPKSPTAVTSGSRGSAPMRGLRLPFILGEILGPPVALREPEF